MRYRALIGSLILFTLGIVLPFWPLALVGIGSALVFGATFLVLIGALIVDVLWGIPTGLFHWLALPYTTLVCVGIIARAILMRYLRD